MFVIFIIFSWLHNLNNFNSLKVRFVKIRCSKAFSIFLIAIKFSFPLDYVSSAAITRPYAPYPAFKLLNEFKI